MGRNCIIGLAGVYKNGFPVAWPMQTSERKVNIIQV